MNKLIILGLGLATLATSCRKTDAVYDTAASTEKVAAPAKAEWTSVSGWSTNKQEKFTVYNGKIADQNITDAIASKGLVLAFKKNGISIQSLPFQEKGASDAYWYYQVSKGEISFACDNYSGEQQLQNNSFTYFILSAEKLADLEKKGYSQIQLMQLSYEDTRALLK